MGDRTIQQAVQILSGTHLQDKTMIFDAVVVSVDQKKRTCVVTAVGGKSANTFTARLMAAVDDGILVLPTVGSTVGILMSTFVKPMVIMHSGVDQVILRGGDLGGLVRVIDLTTKLNAIEDKVNDLITKYNSHVHPGVTAGAGVTAPTASIEPGSLTRTVRTDIENKNINHG